MQVEDGKWRIECTVGANIGIDPLWLYQFALLHAQNSRHALVLDDALRRLPSVLEVMPVLCYREFLERPVVSLALIDATREEFADERGHARLIVVLFLARLGFCFVFFHNYFWFWFHSAQTGF
jgi:hypothetical protein